MGVVLPQYSEKKRKIYEASKLYFEALTQAKSQMQITLMKRLFCHWYYTLVQHDFGKMEIKEQ